MIAEVLSQKFPDNQFYMDVAYEWEETAAKCLGVPVRQVVFQLVTSSTFNKVKVFLRKLFPQLLAARQKIRTLSSQVLEQDLSKPLSLCFLMFPAEMRMCTEKNCLPIFLDLWSEEDMKLVAKATQNMRLFYVTSRDVLQRIKAISPSSGVRYMPQSVADRYHSENFMAYRSKYIDVFMPGRGNPVLHEYMLRYAAEHSGIKYVYRRENLEYVSPDGSISLRAGSREEYMNILASSKVSLVGCSGIDNARDGTNGICFMTPRFYESAILGCALLGRYPDNEEFRALNTSRYCPNITSYEQFACELERALAQTPEELYAQNRDFIISSLTSRRAEQIQHDLETLNTYN